MNALAILLIIMSLFPNGISMATEFSPQPPAEEVGSLWRLVSDQVMGGRSDGTLEWSHLNGRDCLRMRGTVTTENNGGFLQMARDLAGGNVFDASDYTGVLLEVAGNGERYNLHLRTDGLWFPWQSYRQSFVAQPEWREIRLPFSEITAYRTDKVFRPEKLVRVGLVAIGRNFEADLCLSRFSFYR